MQDSEQMCLLETLSLSLNEHRGIIACVLEHPHLYIVSNATALQLYVEIYVCQRDMYVNECQALRQCSIHIEKEA